jgi:hypothetical protein
MKTRKEFVAILLSLKGDLETRFHVKSIGIFGSVARNENTETSDLDLIVDFLRTCWDVQISGTPVLPSSGTEHRCRSNYPAGDQTCDQANR